MPRLSAPLAGAALLTASLAPAPAAAQSMRDGLYLSFGLGGAVVSGEQGTLFDVPAPCGYSPEVFLWSKGTTNCKPIPSNIPGYTVEEARAELVRTDFGSGLSFQLRIGYNILGYASLEASVLGHGDLDGDAGAGHVGGAVRIHPAQFWIPFQERPWDVDVSFGYGYSIGGYHPAPEVQRFIVGTDDEDDGKGWDGTNLSTGVAFNYMVAQRVSLGVDFKFMFPDWKEWFANWDKGYTGTPVESPDAFIFLPTAQVTFHL